MINWLVEQSLLLSLILSLLLLCGRSLTKWLGANGHYSLWLLVPVSLLINSIDFSFLMDKTLLTSFLVSAKTQASELGHLELGSKGFFMASWLLGVIAITGYYATLHLKTMRSSNNATVAKTEAPELNAELLNTGLQVAFTSNMQSPYLSGVFSPKLIVPVNFQHLFTPQQQTLVLKHELVHLKRKDILWNYLAMALTIVFWFNPLSWLSYRRFRILQELSCDQVALEGTNKHLRLQYAKALLSASSYHSIFNPSQLTFGEKSMLKERLNQLKIRQPSKLFSKCAVALTLLVSGVALTVANADIAKSVDDDVKPIVRIEPLYPVEAVEQGIEGSVRMSFDINIKGKVSNIEITNSEPEGVFDREAVSALKKWKYANLKGKTVRSEVQLEFRLSKSTLEKIEIVAN